MELGGVVDHSSYCGFQTDDDFAPYNPNPFPNPVSSALSALGIGSIVGGCVLGVIVVIIIIVVIRRRRRNAYTVISSGPSGVQVVQ